LFLGTIDYAVPEQIEARPVDGRTDQYALACTAFETLCGQPLSVLVQLHLARNEDATARGLGTHWEQEQP
jgi:hypothetical protein